MATDNQSRQQSGERAQTQTPSAQQGTGQAGRGAAQGSNLQEDATGSGTQQSYGRTGQGAGWQNRNPQGRYGSMVPARGAGTSLFPFEAGMEGGPFSMLRHLTQEMDRLFDTFGLGGIGSQSPGRGPGQGTPSLWSPHIEMGEENGKLVIQADLPGIRKEDVNVEVESDQVVIHGERNQQRSGQHGSYYHSERSYGSFYRVIPLPEGVDGQDAQATFRDGVLHIELPMPQQRTRARRLEIRDGGEQAYQGSGSSAGTSGASASSATGASGGGSSSTPGSTTETGQTSVGGQRGPGGSM